MIPSSACQPWPPDQPGQAGIVVALGSYTTIRDTTNADHNQVSALKIKAAFNPPNANEFDMAAKMVIGRP